MSSPPEEAQQWQRTVPVCVWKDPRLMAEMTEQPLPGLSPLALAQPLAAPRELVLEDAPSRETMEHRGPWWEEMLEMGPGKSFGELSLQTDEPRALSVYAKTDAHFLIITKDTFKRNLLKAEQRK